MSDQIDDIVIPILRTLQNDMGVVKEAVRRIDARITTMDHYMAGFYSEQHWQNSELDHLKSRIEKLEPKPEKPSE
jgi:hypothetical protein